MQSLKERKYFYELNFVRGIACLLVVMVHVTARHYYLNDQYFNWFTFFLNQFSRFGTPLFAIIAGFLLFNQSFRGRFQIKRFIKSRFAKIFVPFLVWSFVYLYIKDYPFPWLKGGNSFEEFLTLFFLGDAQYHLYFIILVIEFYLLFLVLQFAKKEKTIIFLTVLSFFINYFFMRKPFDFGHDLLNTFLQDRSSLFYWIFYFMLGGLFAYYWNDITNWLKNNINLNICLGLIVIVFSVYEYNTFVMYSSTRISNLLFIPVIFMFLASTYFALENSDMIRKLFVNLGNLSMGIYLVHPLVILFLDGHIPIIFDRTRYVLVAYIITVLLSILIVKIIQRLPFGSYIVTVATIKKKG